MSVESRIIKNTVRIEPDRGPKLRHRVFFGIKIARVYNNSFDDIEAIGHSRMAGGYTAWLVAKLQI